MANNNQQSNPIFYVFDMIKYLNQILVQNKWVIQGLNSLQQLYLRVTQTQQLLKYTHLPMQQPTQPFQTNKFTSYLSLSSTKPKPSQHPTTMLIQKLMIFQENRFEQINNGCTFIESCIAQLQQTLDRLEEKLQQLNDSQSSQTIFNLKNKQNEFIIHELKQKIKKLQKNQELKDLQLKHLKKQIDSIKKQQRDKNPTEISKQHKNTLEIQKQQILKLQKQLKQKDDEITLLNSKVTKQQQRRLSSMVDDKLQKEKLQDYKLLENKLQELQKDFQGKVTKLQLEVKQKTLKIKQLEDQKDKNYKQIQSKEKLVQQVTLELENIKSKSSASSSQIFQQQSTTPITLTFNPSITSKQSLTPSPSFYQLQLKLTHQQSLYKQLQQQYTTHLTASNNLEIQLHQQIHQQKIQLQQQKKKQKTQKKKTIQLLQSLATFINKRTFNYFDNDVENIIEELKKIFTKEKNKWQQQIKQSKITQQQLKDKINELQKEYKKHKNQNTLIKHELENYKQQLTKLQALRQKQKKAKRQSPSQIITESKKQKSSLNGSLGQISNTKSQTITILEQKYRSTIDSLRLQLQQKQNQITQLQHLQTVDFEKSKQKILAIESQLADAKNENKKLQRQLREVQQKNTQLLKQIETRKLAIQETKQKNTKQKQLLQSEHSKKIKTLEDKVTKLKQQNQQIDSKCQQKVMKYNKLKAKLQKLQMYNNDTEKRKNAQVQQLIKKNQTLRMQCKLLQEKLNIAQTLQLNTNETTEQNNNTVKSTLGYNKDLIQQIQMQRDRILQQYENKRRDYLKLKQTHDKLIDDKEKLSLQLEQTKQKLQQQIKRKQHQLTKLQQQKDSIINEKQRILSKLMQEKQSLNMQLFQTKKQLTQLKQTNDQLSKQLTKLQQDIANKSKQQYQYLKKQLETQLQLKKKKQKEEQALVQRIKQLKDQNQKLKKQIQQKTKSLENKWLEKLKQKSLSHHQQLSKLKEQHQRKIKDLEQKLSEANIREQNLVNIINYKNLSTSGQIRESMRIDDEEKIGVQEDKNKQIGEDEFEEVHQYNFAVKQKLFTTEQQVQTQSYTKQLDLCQVLNIAIQQSLKRELHLFKLQPVSIHNQPTKRQSIQSQANIFHYQQQLLTLLQKEYPSVLEYITQFETKKVEEHQARQDQEKKVSSIEREQIGVNTDICGRTSPMKRSSIKATDNLQDGNVGRQSIKNRDSINILKQTIKGSSFILEPQLLNHSDHSSVENTPITDSQFIPLHVSPREKFNPESNKIEQINLFENLKPSNVNLQLNEQQINDNFQICQQGESINIGQTALNLQIKEIFNKLRQQLQKVFNGEDISLSMIKILPRQLEDDYNEFIGYVKEKIMEIKNENQLSFIMAEVGDAPEPIDEQLDLELQNFVDKKVTEDLFAYKKLVEEKQALITSLINQRTLQQNTINQMTMQQQQVQEEHENRFMNQCNIYKKEIKQLKNKVDSLEMNFMSLKNVFKNTMEIWVDQYQNEDDLRDNFTIYKSIAKLNELESTRLNYYIFRYKEIKHITD